MTIAFDITLRAAELCKNIQRGTATGGSTTTLVDANHPSLPDDYYNGQPRGTIWFLSGNNANKSAIITDWVDSTHTFTFATQAGACAAGDLYAALPGVFSRDDLWSALSSALADAGKSQTSADITALADTYRYAITYDLVQRVEVIASGATQGEEHFWWRVQTGYLYIDDHLPAAGDTIRVFYYDTPARVTADSTTIPASLDPERLAWTTLYYALLPRTQQAENTDASLGMIFKEAQERRAEFMMRRPARIKAPSPHYGGY